MTKRSLKPSAGPVTWFRNKLRTDPFFSARLKILCLYFATGTVLTIAKGFAVEYSLYHMLYPVAFNTNGEPVREAFVSLSQIFWLERVAVIVFFGIAAFLITEYALRPIRKSADIQKRFVEIVSHEMRTPLTIMKNSIEVALRNKHTLSIEKAGSVMKSNLEEIERMSHTIDFLLAFSILGDSKKALSLQPVSLKEVAEEVIASIRKQYGTANINLTVSDSSGAGRVCGDPVALNTLLFNLVQNAVIHTPPGGTITISIIQNGPYIEMAVADTGNGIHKADLPYIFEPFYRGVSDTRSSGSMGLGLSLVKEIASVHRASVRVASIKDTGTTFTISFHI